MENTTLSMSDLRTTAAQGTWWAEMMLIHLLLVLIKHTFIKMNHQPKAAEHSALQIHFASVYGGLTHPVDEDVARQGSRRLFQAAEAIHDAAVIEGDHNFSQASI